MTYDDDKAGSALPTFRSSGWSIFSEKFLKIINSLCWKLVVADSCICCSMILLWIWRRAMILQA